MSYRKKTLYEKICETFGRIKIRLPKSLEEKYISEINFTNLEIQPYQIFSTAIVIPTIIFLFFSSISIILGVFSIDLLFSILMLCGVVFYFLMNYTSFLVKYVRAKASSEMVLAIVYMSISLRITQNLEKAVEFAAYNLTGPLGDDFKKALFNIRSGKSFSVKEELSKIAEKWKLESQEFNDALSILRETTDITKHELEKSIKEAIEVVIVGTKRRMKEYALKMKTPVTIVNAFGVLLPLLVMVFLPMGIIFLPDAFKQATITTFYTIVLPSVVYILLLQNFYSRPYSYHQVLLSENLEYGRRKKILGITILFIVCSASSILFYNIQTSNDLTTKFLCSIGITNLVGFGIVSFAYLSTYGFESLSKKIIKFEEELPTALYQIGLMSKTGKPLEKIFEDLSGYIKNLEVRFLLTQVIEKIKAGATSLKDAFFNEKYGVLKEYPSKILASSMKAVVDISERGSYLVSETLKSISSYLDDAKEVNKFTDEVLAETTSEMKITSLLFAPIAGGIIIGMLGMLVLTFKFMEPYTKSAFENIPEQQMAEIMDVASWFLNLDKQIPLEYFQIIVGIYIIEIVLMLSWFLGEISYGEDEIRKMKSIGKTLLSGLIIYTFISIGLYSVMNILLSTYMVQPL
ncbi:MAG: type II secretion system F family protein [Candidatus Aenigmarchaeota archaeon]|nr:type II secretion system F family protein [Candidatus Aenigmarchaeota archaeon]MDW8160287.1 type II secretion system F family protein [Candidatus Aenigmarchaeota archaeon]